MTANSSPRGGVIVTGAGGGLGSAVASRLATAGYGVVANDLGVDVTGHNASSTPADDLVRQIVEAGGSATAHHGSVDSISVGQELVELTVKEYGGLAGLVTCHGILRERMIFNMTEEEWRSVVDAHLTGTFSCVRPATAQMREQRDGSVVMLTSAAGMEGSPAQANYSAAKAGIVGLAMSTALSMGKYGVNVNCIAPSATTRMTQRLTERMDRSRPEEERQGPELVATLALALLDPRLRNITGQVFTAAGRRLARWELPHEAEQAEVNDPTNIEEVLGITLHDVGYSQLRRFDALGLQPPDPAQVSRVGHHREIPDG